MNSESVIPNPLFLPFPHPRLSTHGPRLPRFPLFPIRNPQFLVTLSTITERKRVPELAESAILAKVPLLVIGRPYSETDPYYLNESLVDFVAATYIITTMVTVSIQDIRFDFARVKSALERGEELMLTYRNRPLAKLLPVVGRKSGEPDPALTFGTHPENVEPMSNREIDLAIYA